MGTYVIGNLVNALADSVWADGYVITGASVGASPSGWLQINVEWTGPGGTVAITDSSIGASSHTTAEIAVSVNAPSTPIGLYAFHTQSEASSFLAQIGTVTSLALGLAGSGSDNQSNQATLYDGIDSNGGSTGGIGISADTGNNIHQSSIVILARVLGTTGPIPITPESPAPPTYADYMQISGNWGRLGGVVPNVGAATDVAKVTAPGLCCSQLMTPGEYLSPTEYPLTWISGQYGQYQYCVESACIVYLSNVES